QSIMDYIFRRLALDYLPFESRSALGIYSAEERQRHLETGSYEPIEETGMSAELIEVAEASVVEDVPVVEEEGSSPVVEVRGASATSLETTEAEAGAKPAPKEAHTSAELLEKITGTAVDSPLCFTCGTKMRPAGSCYVCEGCGSTSGCS
ncbi:MAG TPA: vitamin B12-dependent ribonucleotide reductase, partial [Nocardioides sp.]|nr:vitamin B12-dependent ribonucleotide reductase [Nocardioides sp.]